jgi:diguanylate cyclase (GGDEF)-like protein
MTEHVQPTGSVPLFGVDLSSAASVLIADDDPMFRRVLQSWLEKWKYTVISVDNGTDAWSALQEKNAPQMVIIDWMMPGMDGTELCRKLRGQQESRYRYILLITAKDQKQDVVSGLDAGADDYLTKPFDVDELRARVRAGSRILELQDALIRAHDKLQFEASHDPLTGLWNRGAILDFLQRESSRHRRTSDPLGLIMADLDHFKQINDTYGHLAGDVVLREVGKRMVRAVRGYDFVGRYGGEEFLIIVPGCGTSALKASAERIRRSVCETPIESDGASLHATVSLGLVSAILGAQEFLGLEPFIEAADEALYQAKRKGRNRVETAGKSLAASNATG